VLLVLGVLSLAGIVSADDYYTGLAPVTVATGSVTGDVYVQWADTWNKTPVTDWSQQETWANFTSVPTSNVAWARLYVVDYLGSMTANDYTGTETVKWYGNSGTPTDLAVSQPLSLQYTRLGGLVENTSVSTNTAYFKNLSRDTSDYLSTFDVTNLVDSGNINVYLKSTNVTGKFDGRFKEAKLVVAYNNPGSGSVTRYWVNVGQDPVTYKSATSPAYVGTTTFNGVSWSGDFNSATLYTDDLAAANGVYKWIGGGVNESITLDTQDSNGYARFNEYDFASSEVPTGNNFSLKYDRPSTQNFYKLAIAILKVTSTA